MEEKIFKKINNVKRSLQYDQRKIEENIMTKLNSISASCGKTISQIKDELNVSLPCENFLAFENLETLLSTNDQVQKSLVCKNI